LRVPNYTGPIQKIVILKTDAPGGGIHVVRVKVEVPSILILTPERLTWPIGAAAEGKLLHVVHVTYLGRFRFFIDAPEPTGNSRRVSRTPLGHSLF